MIMCQNNVELVRIDFLIQNQHLFSFQNQLKDKKFMSYEKHLMLRCYE